MNLGYMNGREQQENLLIILVTKVSVKAFFFSLLGDTQGMILKISNHSVSYGFALFCNL